MRRRRWGLGGATVLALLVAAPGARGGASSTSRARAGRGGAGRRPRRGHGRWATATRWWLPLPRAQRRARARVLARRPGGCVRPALLGRAGGAAAHLGHLTGTRRTMELTPREKDKLLLFTAGAAGRAAQGARPQAQLPRGGRVHLGGDPRGRARRPHRRRADDRGDAPARRGRRDGRRRRADPRGAGRGDLPRRHQAGHRAPADPGARARSASARSTTARRRRSSSTTGRATVPARGRQHRRSADPGRLALPLLRDQPGAASSIAPQARGFRLDIPAGTAVRFEPGQTRTVELVAYDGERVV